jgi:hypothetical protein
VIFNMSTRVFNMSTRNFNNVHTDMCLDYVSFFNIILFSGHFFPSFRNNYLFYSMILHNFHFLHTIILIIFWWRFCRFLLFYFFIFSEKEWNWLAMMTDAFMATNSRELSRISCAIPVSMEVRPMRQTAPSNLQRTPNPIPLNDSPI